MMMPFCLMNAYSTTMTCLRQANLKRLNIAAKYF
jgi:hypothetical protein